MLQTVGNCAFFVGLKMNLGDRKLLPRNCSIPYSGTCGRLWIMSQFQLGISQSTMRVAALQLHKFFGTLSIAFALYRLIMKTF